MILQCEHIDIAYPKALRPALRDVSLQLRAGDIGVLIGPSGCGKTTLLRSIAGLERPSRGRICIDGQIVADDSKHVPAEQRRVGMVFQDFALFPHLNVQRNIAFGLAQLGAVECKARVQAMLSLVGLEGYGERQVHQLSGGQQQRVALARALAPMPKVLLMDEPFSSLDADLREQLAHELRRILKAAGVTALFVTHDQLEAFAVGDCIGVMRDGCLEQWGSAYDLYHRPASRFVATFIGHGCFVRATVAVSGAQPELDTSLGRIVSTRGCILPQAPVGQSCDLLIRSDDVLLDPLASTRATVLRKIFRGAQSHYTLQLSSGETIVVQAPSHHRYEEGSKVGILPQLEHLVTFA